jgi:hypothetical protein
VHRPLRSAWWLSCGLGLRLRIPMKPDAYSKVKPDIYSVFIPDSVPI